MNDATTRLDEIIEAALLAAGEPLSVERLEALFGEHECPPRRELRTALTLLGERLDQGALELIETASGFQLRIRQRLSPWISRLWDERPQRYSRALLETLALIAYRQPVTRGDIEEVRGVAVSGSIMRTLTERGWIRVVGQRDVPGRPSVYATTRAFLDDFGLKTLDGLPPMHELKDFEERFAELEAPAEEGEPPAPAESPSGESSQTEQATEHDISSSPADEAENEPLRIERITTAGTADETHAGTASARSGLSFADLEARLADRARQESTVDDDGRAGTEHSTDESTFDS